MKEEINRLKKEYENTKPPVYLNTFGVSDLWERVDFEKHSYRFHFSKFMVIGVLVFIVLTGFLGIASAKSAPGTSLYPVKKLTQEAVKAISEIKPFDHPKPLRVSPTPSIAPTVTSHHEKTDEEQNQKSDTQKMKDGEKEVKGINTSETGSSGSASGSAYVKNGKVENQNTNNQQDKQDRLNESNKNN